MSWSFDDGGGLYMSACTTSGGSTRVCAGCRPKLTLYGTVNKNVASILVSSMGCSVDLVVHQNVKVRQKYLFAVMV